MQWYSYVVKKAKLSKKNKEICAGFKIFTFESLHKYQMTQGTPKLYQIWSCSCPVS